MKQHTSEPWPIIISAVNKLVDFIKPTYGPSNNKVILRDKVLDDGFAIANEFELDDPYENRIVNLIKEVSQKTNKKVGDGTTTSLLLLQAILNEIDKTKGSEDLTKALAEAKEQLLKQATVITTKDDLEKVAFNSFNNPQIAKIIAEALYTVGLDGAITVEDSPSLETTYELNEGMQIESGFVSSYMTNDGQRAVWENPYVLITDQKINSIQKILPIVEKIAASGSKNLVIIAEEIEGEALATFVVNKMKGNFNVLGIKAPSFGEIKKEILEDIAALVGAKVLTLAAGYQLDNIGLGVLGKVTKVIAIEDVTTIIGGEGDVTARIENIKTRMEKAEDYQKRTLEQRLAKLTGGIAVIKVGASTESELTALKYKVEDAVNASKRAYKSGVVQGAGLALTKVQTSSKILNAALKYPTKQLLENSSNLDENVTDPVEVLIAALENAVSITNLLLSSKGILIDAS